MQPTPRDPKFFSIRRKLILRFLGIVLICALSFGALMLFLGQRDLESALGSQLEAMARTATLLIPQKAHEQILQAYLTHDPELRTRPYFLETQKALAQIQKENELPSDVFTFIRSDWANHTFIFMASSNPSLNTGNGFTAHSNAHLTLDQGISTHSHFYRKQGQWWISAFAPIRNPAGKAVAALEVDYPLETEIRSLLFGLLKSLGVLVLIGSLFAVLLALAFAKTLLRPVEDLTMAAKALAGGNLKAKIETIPHDELGILIETYNLMVDHVRKSRRDLEDYSSRIEINSDQKTAELKNLTRLLKTSYRYSNQAYFTFGSDGICGPWYSRSCETVLEKVPEGKPMWEVLRYSEVKGLNWVMALFHEKGPFENLAAQGPPQYPHTRHRKVFLEYHPIRDDNEDIVSILVIASDKTEETHHLQVAEQEKLKFQQVTNLVRNKDLLTAFLLDSVKHLDRMENELKKAPPQTQSLGFFIQSMFHLREGADLFLIPRIQDLASASELALTELRETGRESSKEMAFRLNSDIAALKEALHDFVEQQKELLGVSHLEDSGVLAASRNQLMAFSERLSGTSALEEEFRQKFLEEPIQNFVLPLGEYASRLAAQENKELRPVQFKGGSLRVLAGPYSSLLASLFHAFRNAVNHSIELPEERVVAGKPREAMITVYFAKQKEKEKSIIKILVHDDGKGISNPHELLESDLGLKLLSTNVKQMGGLLEIQSKAGKGTLLSILVPEAERARASSRVAS